MDNKTLKRLPGAIMVAAVAMLLVWCAMVTYQDHGKLAPLDSIHRATVAMADRFATPTPEPTGWAQERIIDLPEDGSQFYLTLFLHDDWNARPQDRQLVAWLQTHPGLISLQAQCHYVALTPSNALFRSRWSTWSNSLPAVLLQQGNPHTGKVTYKAGPTGLPQSANALANQIDSALDVLRQQCPKPKPPGPPPVVVPPFVQPIPDIIPPDTTVQPADNPSNVVTIVIMIAVGLVCAFWGFGEEMFTHFANAMKGEPRER